MHKIDIKSGDKFKHFKGEIYTVLGFIFCSITGNLQIKYTKDGSEEWTRDLSEWLGYHNSGQKRFVKIEEDWLGEHIG